LIIWSRKLRALPGEYRKTQEASSPAAAPESWIMMLNFGSRRVSLCDISSFGHIKGEIDGQSYALLLLADEKSEFQASLAVAFEAAGAGCRKICCMGYVSSELEGALDATLELQRRLGVVTT
jgi:hypothetical protein